MKRRTFLKSGAGIAAVAGVAAPAIAQERIEWNMPSSFPKPAPGVGTNATRFAELVEQLSGGRMVITVYGAGELVPPFAVEDAVQAGNAPIGHGTPYYAASKTAAAHWFTGVPFGLTANEHYAWLKWGGGQQIWDEIYAERNLKPFYSGNSGTQAGGWFKSRIDSLADLQGLNMRIAGLGGEMMRKLGVNAILMPATEIFQALQSGAIDAAEWVGPLLDQAFGLQRITNLCYTPAYAEPGAALQVVVNTDAWAGLSDDLKAIIEAAAAQAAMETLAQFDYFNVTAMASLQEAGVEFLSFPDEVVAAMKTAWDEVREEQRAASADAARVLDSYEAYRTGAVPYANAFVGRYLNDR
ncbi:MAG: TRAP transporter substrate-binding protein [Rhodobacter sp.]|uniref:TRAP transporter substrate-binding protein n=1 Tax=Pararhodobacter sp. TaxID=2127056 RepID=UPI001D386D95|nr:TRAP transporter substrate-binding protein [Pararhodobacter sp.]MCB1345983.1 TRAP transporter substrate-binding protein [Paracoccaceae bacterium]MCC0074065.1 TRAP transporter substrate-binding protein [Rhodobacter sp.]HPD91833.1 TRAP transporter substrate-binding protein [Pararhodobacter sp.]